LSKVTLKGYILVPPEDFEVVTAALIQHKKFTLEEPGCIIFQVIPDSNDLSRFNVYEEFIDQAAFEQHQERVKLSNWGKVTVNVERHYQISTLPR